MIVSKFLKACFCAGFLLILPPLFAREAEVIYEPYELDLLIHNIEKPGAPIITEDYIVFTAEPGNRFVGIAFDFEDYKIIHPYQILNSVDADGNKTPKHMFYSYKREHKFTSIKYRVIIDGLWTTDPMNPNKIYDDNVNLYFSYIEEPNSIKQYTEIKKPDGVRFIYKGESGLKLRLGGTFTNWDPWIYELKETSKGFYELELPLPKGKYYYNYYIGLTPIVDNTNPNKAYTADGRTSSVIYVE